MVTFWIGYFDFDVGMPTAPVFVVSCNGSGAVLALTVGIPNVPFGVIACLGEGAILALALGAHGPVSFAALGLVR